MRTALLLTLLAGVAAPAVWQHRPGGGESTSQALPAARAGATQAPQVRAAQHQPAPDRLDAQIAALVSAAPQPRTWRRALATRRAILAGDFVQAAIIAKEVLSESQVNFREFYPFDYFMARVPVVDDAQYELRLSEWVEASPDVAIARRLRAQLLREKGRQVRSGRFTRDVPEDDLRAFGTCLAMSEADAEAAITLGPGNPWADYNLLSTLKGQGDSQRMAQAFADAVARHPDYYPLCDSRLATLAPKWGALYLG